MRQDDTIKRLRKELAQANKRISQLESLGGSSVLIAEEKLQDSEGIIRALLSSSLQSIFIIDTSGTLLAVNSAFAHRFGYEPSELLDRCVHDLLPPETARRRRAFVEEVIRTAKPGRFEDQREGKWIDSVAYPISDARGKISKLLIYVYDITELKQAEEHLLHVEEELRAERDIAREYINIAGVILVALDKEGQITLINRRGYETLGYQEEELLGKNWFMTCLPAQMSDDVAREFRKLIAGDLGNIEYYENPIITKHGEERLIAWHNTLLRDEEGNITGSLSSGEDITERKEAGEALARSESKYRELVENVNSVILRWNRNGRITFINEYGQTFFGYSAEELIGKDVSIFVPEKDSTGTGLSRLVQDILNDPEQYVNNVNENIRKDGSRAWMSWTNKPIFNENGILTEVLAIGNDISDLKNVQEALRKSEMMLSEAERIAHLGYWDWDIKTGKTQWSDEVYRIFGLDPGDSITNYASWFASVHPDDRKAVEDAVNRSLADRRNKYKIEYRIVRPDGLTCIVLERGEVMFGAVGNPVRMIGTVLDITERKQIEEHSQHLASFPQLNPNPVIELSSSGEVRYRNPAAQKMLEDHGLNGDDCSPFWPPGLHDLLQMLSQGKAGSFYREVAIKDRVFAETLQLIPQFSTMRIYAHDISERTRTEEALRQSEQQYRIMGETLPYGVWLADASGGAVYVSQSYLDLIEMTQEQMHHFGWTHRLPPEDVEPMKEKWMHSVRTGEPWDNEHRILGPDGKYHTVLTRALPVRNEKGEITCWVGINLDIDERKAMEEELRTSRDELEHRVQERTVQLQEAYESLQLETKERQKAEEQLRQSQKMEAIGTLAGGIAHDFNNILAAILGFTEMAIDDSADYLPVQKSLQKIHKSALRARDLVKQILAFSRKTNYERAPLSLSSLVKETAQLLRASIPANIEIKLAITAASDTILAAPTEVQQILMNLATNASLAMEEKGGILEIKLTDIDFMPDLPLAETDGEPGEYLQLMVKDTGTGMDPDVMKKAFEPFFTTREVGTGTGMGLAVVYGIVTDLQGTITVESEPGIGSTFRVFLPKVTTELKEDDTPTRQIPTGTESILFIDDEDMLVEWAKATFERLGYRATALTDPAEALKTFSSDPSRFDLVITDQSMSSMSGMRLAKELLRIRPDIPVILCTGHSTTVSPETAKEAGIKQFLMKPLTRQELARAVRHVLDDRRKNKKQGSFFDS